MIRFVKSISGVLALGAGCASTAALADNPVENPIGIQKVQSIGDTFRSEELASMGRCQEATTSGNGESIGEWSRWKGGLVTIEPETDHACGGQFNGEFGCCARCLRTLVPVGSNHEPKSDTELVGCGEAGIENAEKSVSLRAQAIMEETGP